MTLPELSGTEVEAISQQSGIEPNIVKSWYKEFMVVCPNGHLDRKHFYRFYKQLVQQPKNDLDKIVDYVFAAFDRNSNGKLDFSEFLIAYACTTSSEPLKKLEFIFLFYDEDKDGYLTGNEFLIALERLYVFRGKDTKVLISILFFSI